MPMVDQTAIRLDKKPSSWRYNRALPTGLRIYGHLPMKTIPLGPTDRQVSALVQGCMTFGALDQAAVDAAIGTAIDAGITMFDHADVYRAGASEARFGDWLVRHAGMRDDIIIQSKCGIRPDSDGDAPCQRYDFSRAHILASVEGSLARLRTDHLDVLLFHRPDALMEVEEVAATCADLRQAGKVRHFGVSNQGAAQMKLMEQAVGSALVANQLELNIIHNGLIDYGIRINRPDNPVRPMAVMRSNTAACMPSPYRPGHRCVVACSAADH